ncbi:hypothetical protein [Acetobacter sp. AAB5]|uniref:hypothetical protein n=1 Tax=Acetobacter sp. AAB5 TaxID=3418370 RepID=UPI003CEC261B
MSCRLSALPALRLFTLVGYAQQALPTTFKAPAPLIGLHGLWGSRLSDLVAYECTKLANCFDLNPEKLANFPHASSFTSTAWEQNNHPAHFLRPNWDTINRTISSIPTKVIL